MSIPPQKTENEIHHSKGAKKGMWHSGKRNYSTTKENKETGTSDTLLTVL